jgi:hypothetical protein
MSNGYNVNSILVVAKDNLKRRLAHAAGPVPSVDANEPFRVGLNARNRYSFSLPQSTASAEGPSGQPLLVGLSYDSEARCRHLPGSLAL